MSDRRDAEQEAYEQRSWRELEAGHLPLRAQERLAAMDADGAFTSDLSVAEHHAVRSVGFVPVGQVLGTSVFQIGWSYAWDCGAYGNYRGYNTGGFSGRGVSARTVTTSPWADTLRAAQRQAVSRLEQEAQALGAHGVVAVRFRELTVAQNAVEFHVVGTAVRAAGERPTGWRPFTCALSGVDFATLLQTGSVPTALLFGVAVATRHDDWYTGVSRRSWQNVEIIGYTDLVTTARAQARQWLARAAASSGAQAVVLSSYSDRIYERECRATQGGRDHLVRSTFLGTGTVPMGRRETPELPEPLPILRLRDRTKRDIERTGERTIRG